jgi:hypothetical protein
MPEILNEFSQNPYTFDWAQVKGPYALVCGLNVRQRTKRSGLFEVILQFVL